MHRIVLRLETEKRQERSYSGKALCTCSRDTVLIAKDLGLGHHPRTTAGKETHTPHADFVGIRKGKRKRRQPGKVDTGLINRRAHCGLHE